MALSTEDFRQALTTRLRAASLTGADHLDLSAGELHLALGGSPGSDHRWPACCAAMRAAMRAGDVILSAPPKGNGASLIIRYRLPRR